MIKQSSLLKWAHNGGKSHGNGSVKVAQPKNNWIHPPDALQRDHVAYVVKFLGDTEVEQPKGIDVVREAIRKLKFNQHLKRAEGAKATKVELTISVDGVAIQEPKTKSPLHQYPLHRISYCADDKTDKKFFSFIAKEADSERHSCFVFVSDKLAEEITLTIGQAFDLAYKRFLETSGRDLVMKRQLMVLQKRLRELEQENSELKLRLGSTGEPTTVKPAEPQSTANGESAPTRLNGSSGEKSPPPRAVPMPPLQPPPAALPRTLNRSFTANQSVNLLDIDASQMVPSVGRRLENLKFDDKHDNGEQEEEEDFNPRKHDSNGVSHNNGDAGRAAGDLFVGGDPFPESGDRCDPFGMGIFGQQELETAIGAIDKRLAEMRDGFSRGLSFGNDEFAIENQKT